jgi:hypothetical protein
MGSKNIFENYSVTYICCRSRLATFSARSLAPKLIWYSHELNPIGWRSSRAVLRLLSLEYPRLLVRLHQMLVSLAKSLSWRIALVISAISVRVHNCPRRKDLVLRSVKSRKCSEINMYLSTLVINCRP